MTDADGYATYAQARKLKKGSISTDEITDADLDDFIAECTAQIHTVVGIKGMTKASSPAIFLIMARKVTRELIGQEYRRQRVNAVNGPEPEEVSYFSGPAITNRQAVMLESAYADLDEDDDVAYAIDVRTGREVF